ncbi:NUDIX family protein [Frankia canadensis]|uniref:NUDIX family protein n=1 Tax=Frankia canadensis TaxID=1836972 RepID=A0A2I2KSN2_9ACTN|nr:NUDIX domain-containing protein [Frankia canadensis]SNQ48675.1 NUDIX family protein [Frankia canadensis]SOU55965.1 NUDIX family protein [Frankia canadensis]
MRERRGGATRLTFLGPAPDPPFERVTSAAVVALTGDGRLVVAELDRGLDIPGGHVQRGETSIDQTVRRETWEEVRARLGALLPVEVVESDYFGADDLSYMVIRAARVTELALWEPTHESAGRRLVTPEEFLAGYRGRPAFMRHLVTRALAILAADRYPDGDECHNR